MEHFKEIFQNLFHLLNQSSLFRLLIQSIVPLTLIIILFTSSKKIIEVITALFVIFVLGFYYADPITVFLKKFPFLEKITYFSATKISASQSFILKKLPEFDGISLFGKKFLSFHVNEKFAVTHWPAYLLIAGVIIRLILGKYVRNERLKQIGREYWLYITTYLITALVVSYVIDWSYIEILFISLIIAFVIAGGLLRVGADLINGLLAAVNYIIKTAKVTSKYLALLAAKIAKALRSIVRFVRELYNTYILGPFYWLDKIIKNFLNKLEQKADKLLEDEKIDE